jgi:hypothetical protein
VEIWITKRGERRMMREEGKGKRKKERDEK